MISLTRQAVGPAVEMQEEARDDWLYESVPLTTVEVKKSFLQFQKLLRPDVPG